MAHDVFLSYSSIDKTAADTVCSILEQKGISCWMAPRDITPGLDFAEAIVDGIKSSKLFILLYSSNSNNSKQVIREVDRAVHSGLPVINLRLEDVPLSKQLEYYLGSVHWLDALTPPLEGHIDKLSEVVKIFLRKDDSREDDLEKVILDGILHLGQDKSAVTAGGKNKKKKRVVAVAIIAVIVIALILIISPLLKQKLSAKPTSMERSIAVLPFRNDSPEDSTQYFMDGVMEELLNNLQTIKSLRVCGRTSVEKYREQNKTISEIARELGVNYIIEGSGQKSGKSLRMRVQLIAAEKKREKHIWANSFEQENIDLKTYFKTQSSFAEEIANELNAALTQEEKQLIEKMPTQSLSAYEAYLKGQVYWRKLTQVDIETAIKYFDLAKEIDPDYAPAYAGISIAWAGLVQSGYVSPEEGGPNIMSSLTRALELDSTLADVQYTLACITTWVLWDWAGGESAFKKAININPNFPEARAYYSHFLNMLGRPDEAREQIDLALKLDPANPLIMSIYSIDLIFFKRYDEAITVANEALVLDPTAPVALSALELAYHLAGRKDETIEILKKYFSTIYKFNTDVFDVNYKKSGYEKTLEIAADTIVGQLSRTYFLPIDIAWLYLMSGDHNKALNWVEKAFEIRDQNLPYLLLPIFDPLRSDIRFQEIARKMNLPYK
jgi:TolB-like protein